MDDQQQHWEHKHIAGAMDHYKKNANELATELISIIPPEVNILELGCGVGVDSVFFAENGHQVLATDFSESAIKKNKLLYNNSNLTFQVLDISKLSHLEAGLFDVIYARLSLHYFSDRITKEIFREIHKILKSQGYFAFLCKSTKDPLYGNGREVEKNMFENDGQVRHFFTEEYAIECLQNMFSIISLESFTEIFAGKPSSFVKVIAKKV